MSMQTKTLARYADTISEKAQALLSATSDVAETKVCEARKQLAVALDSGKDIYGRALDGAVRGAKTAGQTAKENPYASVGVALLVGALLALLFTRPRK